MNEWFLIILAFYGYPYCWSAYDLRGKQRGEQIAHAKFYRDGVHTDAWCNDDANVVKPAYQLTVSYL
jgi:hypothetical protein